MKKMNFWKTLLGSVLVLASFTACSDDDTETKGSDSTQCCDLDWSLSELLPVYLAANCDS